jgi:hypothetical protein
MSSLRVLPHRGKKRNHDIQQLLKRGISTVGQMNELNDLADTVYQHLWSCVVPQITIATEGKSQI